MPGPTSLLIRSRNLAPRVVPLEGLAVRVGRGPQCEVRLDEPGLADVQCLLRRRGESWHIQPVGPPGLLFLDGRSIETQRLWPAGVLLCVGDHSLSLHRGEPSAERIGSFEAPIPVEPKATEAELGRPAVFVGRDYSDPTTTGPSGSLAAERERLRRWEAQLRYRERWLEARREERRWEARWRAAGESLRARSAGAGRPSMPTVVEPSDEPRDDGDRRRTRLEDEGCSSPENSPPPKELPPPAAESGEDAWPSDPTGPEAAPVVPAPAPVDPEVDDFRASWDAEPDVGVPAIDEVSPAETPPPSGPDGPSLTVPTEPGEGSSTTEERPAPAVEPTGTTTPRRPPTRGPAPVRLGTVIRMEPGHRREDHRPIGRVGQARATPETPSPSSDPLPRIEAPPHPDRPPGEPSPEVVPRRPWDAPSVPEIGEAPPNSRMDDLAPWPSAGRILQGRPRPRPSGARRGGADRAAARPQPTPGRPPQRWTLPVGLVLFPATLATLGLGALGIGLGWTWGQDDRIAGLIADRMLGKAELPGAPVTDVSQAPSPSWWGSTAAHLYLRALAESRSPDDPDAEGRVRLLVNAARAAAPLEPQANYALAVASRGSEDQTAAIPPIGLSRDIVSLAAIGKGLHRAGKLEAARNAFRTALAMAEAIEAERAPTAPFDEDRQVQRFALPGEDLLGPVIEGMARLDWPFAEWSAALPHSGRAAIACYRVLRQLESPDAERALDPIPAESSGAESPVELAARAEVSAFREDWEQSESLYRRAIEGMASDSVRRSWWYNLGSIAWRAGDATGANEAWERAKSSRPGDEVHRRVAEAEVRAGIAARPAAGSEDAPSPRP